MQMVGGNGGNQFRHSESRCLECQNGLIVVPGIANPNANQNGNGNVIAERAEGNGNGSNENQIRCHNYRGLGYLDEIEEVNANCILMANLQQASTSGNLKLLINFVWKFLGTIRFRNDHIAAILGYGDL
ncbi:hypothetical protein Tco_1566687 [Tanacetum coccineum]